MRVVGKYSTGNYVKSQLMFCVAGIARCFVLSKSVASYIRWRDAI